jgi:hypothetical protein
MVDRPLGELEEVLAASFFRIHRSYLVNLSRVGAIVPEDGGTYRVVMRDETTRRYHFPGGRPKNSGKSSLVAAAGPPEPTVRPESVAISFHARYNRIERKETWP